MTLNAAENSGGKSARKCALKQRGEVVCIENGAGDLTFISSGFEDFCLKLQRMLQLTKEFLLKMYAEWL